MMDPRPDLQSDSAMWTKLLSMAEADDAMCAGVLHGFRCGGLRIRKENRGYVLRPEFTPGISIWNTPEEYAHDREQWLVPYGNQIVKLLDRLGGAA